jgi:hypothetical protein
MKEIKTPMEQRTHFVIKPHQSADTEKPTTTTNLNEESTGGNNTKKRTAKAAEISIM